MVEPPSFPGVAQVREAWLLPGAADNPVGAPGVPAVVELTVKTMLLAVVDKDGLPLVIAVTSPIVGVPVKDVPFKIV